MAGSVVSVKKAAGRYAAETTSLVGSIVSWCDALNGSASLHDGFRDLLFGLGAEAGMLVRTDMHDRRPTRIATVDLAIGAASHRPLHRSFSDSYFGTSISRARTGTMWFASAHADDSSGDPALGIWQSSRRMKEFVVLVLSAGGTLRDHIELHFRDRLCADDQDALLAILPEVVRVWAGRKTGLIARTIINHRVPAVHAKGPPIDRHLLSAENPARLSRAEFRVCMLLSRGLLVPAVARELKLSEPTIRTHLRNIYAKTESSCLAELVFQLMDGSPSRTAVPAARLA